MSDLGIRPLNARSLVLSVLLGLPRPALPPRALVALADAFGVAPGTMRTALSRMVDSGELMQHDGEYHLSGRLLERKESQDVGRRPAVDDWNGDWWVAVVTAPRREVGERRAFRQHMANLRMGELRPDTWMRPANLAAPLGDATLAVVRGPLDGEGSAALAARLWRLDEIAREAVALRGLIDAATPRLGTLDPSVLPGTIELAAAVVRFLRAEPLLPSVLTPNPWPPDALRASYRAFDDAFGRALAPLIAP